MCDPCNGDRLYLSEEQIQEFVEQGVLVVDNLLQADELREAQDGLTKTLASFGIDSNDLASTGHALQHLNSTNGSGGVLDIFYPDWKMSIGTNPRLFRMTTQLWQATYCHNGERLEELAKEDIFRWHPYGAFDCHQGYLYIDRIGYRLPTLLAEQLGAEVHGNEITKKKKIKPLQRSLTPHLDCCPPNLYDTKSKWRPIQCFVSLSDSIEPSRGGFEAAREFHQTFHQWVQHRPPTKVVQKMNGTITTIVEMPAPCIGEYTHIRPTEDRDVMDRVQHIPVRAGSVVFWDNRIPHANAYRHAGHVPRAVIYCSFLPNIDLNRQYVHQQWMKWKMGQPPTDTWIHVDKSTPDGKERQDMPNHDYNFTPLGRKLMGIDPWS